MFVCLWYFMFWCFLYVLFHKKFIVSFYPTRKDIAEWKRNIKSIIEISCFMTKIYVLCCMCWNVTLSAIFT